jgi:hypothetical protein
MLEGWWHSPGMSTVVLWLQRWERVTLKIQDPRGGWVTRYD